MRAAPPRPLLVLPLLAALLAAGCAGPDGAADGWRLVHGDPDAPEVAFRTESGRFDAEATVTGRHVRGAYEPVLPAGAPFELRWAADAPFEARVEARTPAGDAWRAGELVCSSQEPGREWRDDVVHAFTEGNGTACVARVTPLAPLDAPGEAAALSWRLVPRALPERPLEPPPDPPETVTVRFEARGVGMAESSA